MYVTTWDITTKLHVKQAGSLRDSYALTFGEALLRYGRELQKEHLVAAYRRAGQSFGRLLEEHFVVLSEKMRLPPPRRYNDERNDKAQRATVPATLASFPAVVGYPEVAIAGGSEMQRKQLEE